MNTALQKKIFIVDDDRIWNRKLTETLTHLGCTNIACFESGEDCIKKLHLNPAIIFLDSQMKAIDGLEVLRRVKMHLPGTNIVFCTANQDMVLEINAMKSGSNVFLLKQQATEGKIRTVLESVTTADVVALG